MKCPSKYLPSKWNVHPNEMSIQMKCPFKYCLLLYWVGLGWIVWLGWVELSDCLIGLGWSACIALSDSTILAIFGLDGSIGLGWRLRVVRWLLILAGYLCSGGAVGWVCPGLVCSYSPRIFYAFLFNSPIRGVLNVFSSFFSLQQFLYPWYWCGCSSRPCFP